MVRDVPFPKIERLGSKTRFFRRSVQGQSGAMASPRPFEFLGGVVGGGEEEPKEGPNFKSDLLEHYNLRSLYDNLAETKWAPPKKVGKAEYFVYSTIAGDGHLRSDVSESNRYDLAPLAEMRKAAEEAKLRPLGSKAVREALPLRPGHFELPKAEVGVAIHKRDKKGRGAKRLASAAETTRSVLSKEIATRDTRAT